MSKGNDVSTQITCPRCLTNFRIKQNPEGRKLRCTVCGHAFVYGSEEAKSVGKPDPLEGKFFGKCKIEKMIAKGGMGRVYLAHHEMLDSKVAVKTLTGRLSNNQQFIERFYREAKVAAKIHHPNIISVIDCGKENNQHFIMMEFVEGKTLRELVEADGTITENRCLHFLDQTLKALAHAQSLNIIHRDIKPANIMVTPEGTIKLADMGLARSMEEDSQDREITQSGSAIGTPAYMSPEQAIDATNIDFRSDIYSLGATFYFCITGQNPFTGKSHFELLKKAAEEPHKPIAEINKKVSKKFSGIIDKMMAKKPEQRFQSYEELQKAVNKLYLKSEVSNLDDDSIDAEIPVKKPAKKKTSAKRKVNIPQENASDTRMRRKKKKQSKTLIYILMAAILLVLAALAYQKLQKPSGPEAVDEDNPLLSEKKKTPADDSSPSDRSSLDLNKFYGRNVNTASSTPTRVDLDYRFSRDGKPAALEVNETLALQSNALTSSKHWDKATLRGVFNPKDLKLSATVPAGYSLALAVVDARNSEQMPYAAFSFSPKSEEAMAYISGKENKINIGNHANKDTELKLHFRQTSFDVFVDGKNVGHYPITLAMDSARPALLFPRHPESRATTFSVEGNLHERWYKSWSKNPKRNFINKFGNRPWLRQDASAWEVATAIEETMDQGTEEYKVAMSLFKYLHPNGIWWLKDTDLAKNKPLEFLERIDTEIKTTREKQAALKYAAKIYAKVPDYMAIVTSHMAKTETRFNDREIKFKSALSQVKSSKIKSQILRAYGSDAYKHGRYPIARHVFKELLAQKSLDASVHADAMDKMRRMTKRK